MAEKLKVYRQYTDLSGLVSDPLLLKKGTVKSNDFASFVFEEVQSGRGHGRRYNINIIRRIEDQADSQRPLQFATIAMAHKNPRYEICGGYKYPDFAELSFLRHLADIVNGVGSLYPPGANFTVITEGEVYKQFGVFDVEIEEVNEYMSRVKRLSAAVAGNLIKFISLKEILDKSGFEEEYEKVYASLSLEEYSKYLGVMARSITARQVSAGITPEEMARRYRAIHKAKHQCLGGKSAVYGYLESALGENVIYCSVTTSDRLDVLNIDPYGRPGPLPQHGLGVVVGGGDKTKIVTFGELAGFNEKMDLRTIKLNGNYFGLVQFGK